MLNLDDVATFAAVARAGSLSSVARARGVAQTTLGRAIGRLEVTLGVPLMHRTPRLLKLTAAGELFLARAESLIDSARRAEEELIDWSRKPQGVVKVSLCRAYARTCLAAPLARWAALHRDVRLHIVLEERWLDPTTEGVDLAIRTGAPRDVTCVATRVGRYGHVLCGAPSYLRGARAPRHPRDLAEHALLSMRTDRPWTRWTFQKGVESCEVEARAAIEVDDAEMLFAMTVAGAGLTVLPSYLAQPAIDADTLRAVLTQWTLPDGPVLALHAPRRKLTAAARDLLTFLERELAE